MRATVTNPLPDALAHYQAELLDCLADEAELVGDPCHEGIEGLHGPQKAHRALSLLADRLRPERSDVHLVLWPAFGYWDAMTWVPMARRQPVVLVIHDVEPLRAQFGHSRAAQASFRAATRLGDLRIVCHTEGAADRLEELVGVRADVIPHPMLTPAAPPTRRDERPLVRVLGQHKTRRDLEVLTQLADEDSADEFDLEVWGRGWPDLPGWRVRSGFVAEPAFHRLVTSSDVLVMPYQNYWQSGVAVRAAEACRPVVGWDHDQLRFLYGEHWPGAVPRGGSWLDAVRRAITARAEVTTSVHTAHGAVRSAWRGFVEGAGYA
ncbi:MAG: hypothetical protein WCF36_03900 [Candidatus Nanopelagicales bacterium]